MTDLLEGALDPFDLDDNEGFEELDAQPPTVLSFALGGQLFAVDVQRVQEILDLTEINPLPSAPHDILGMIDLRGQGIAIADLGARIGAITTPQEGARIIVFQFDIADGHTSLGVVADKVLRVREMAEKDIEPVPDTLTDWRCDVASGMLRTEDGIAMILDIDKILCGDAHAGPFDFD